MKYHYITTPILLIGLSLTGIANPSSLEAKPALVIAQSNATTQMQQLEKKTLQLINLMQTQEFAQVRSTFAPKLQSAFSPQTVAAKWQELIDQMGEIKKITKTKFVDGVNVDLVVLTIEFTKGKGNIVVSYNSAEQVVGLDFPKTDSVAQISDRFVTYLGKGDYPNARGFLGALLKAELFPEDIKQKWETLLKITGAYKRITDTQVHEGPSNEEANIVIVSIEFEKMNDDMIIIFDSDKRIVGVDFPDLQ